MAIAAVLADVKLVWPFMKQWPPFFKSLGDAKRYVRKIAEKHKLRYQVIPMLAAKKVRKYVAEVIAADAFEAGLFKSAETTGLL